jgi:hypothetical protein
LREAIERGAPPVPFLLFFFHVFCSETKGRCSHLRGSPL